MSLLRGGMLSGEDTTDFGVRYTGPGAVYALSPICNVPKIWLTNYRRGKKFHSQTSICHFYNE